MVRARFMEHVERLRKYIEETGKDMYDLAEIAVALGVSGNYAREIAKAYVHKYGGYYNSGVLVVRRKAEATEGVEEA